VRLFVALEIPASIRETLATFIAELRDLAAQSGDRRPRWVRPENLHVTLKFIGEVAPAKLEELREALAGVRSSSVVEIHFRGLGFFPDEKRPRVFWAGLAASPNLTTLAGDVDRAAATQGIARETRAFSPHLTLARFEPPGMGEPLRAAIQKNEPRDFGSFRTRQLHLIESKLQRSGAQYTSVHSFTFALES
jgi:2'-5' RNA ligase